MDKVDYKKVLKHLYSGKVGDEVIVDVPEMQYLMVDGKGDPNTSEEFKNAIEALYPVAYSLKFMCKKSLEKDYAVMPLEGLFWSKDMVQFDANNKDEWLWTLMIMQPGYITHAMFDEAVKAVAAKRSPPSLYDVRLAEHHEGRAAQVMYVGSYANEGPTIQSLHDFIKQQGGVLDGLKHKHHEVYLSDTRRADPSKLKTIIRQPF